MDIKKLFAFMFVLVLAVSMVSAFEFDDWKSFEKSGKYGKIKITNAFGLGKDLVQYELLENTDQCLINCEANGKVELKEEGRIFDKIIFKDRGGKEKDLSYQVYIKENIIHERVEPIMVKVCTKNITNGMNECVYKQEGEEIFKETKEEWVLYDYKKRDIGTYEWKVKGTKSKDEKVDWVGVAFGKYLEEWAWWDSSWSKRQEVNITGGTMELENFTVFLNISYDSDMQVDFDDIRFVNGSCSGVQTDELTHETSYKVDSSSANVWVKMPTLSIGINSICMYYDNSVASNSSDSVNAWDSNYKSVYHLDGDVLDSKGNVDGTIVGAVNSNTTNCKFGTCYSFIADSSSWIQLDTTFDNMAEMTIESFGYLKSNADYRNIMGQSGGSNDRSWHLRINTGTTDGIFGAYTSAGGYLEDSCGGCVGLNKYNYLASSANGNVYVYVNKTSGSGTAFADTTDISSNNAGIGAIYAGGIIQEWVGEIDEIRFSTTVRSTAWLNRSYDNIDSSLVTFGDEETANGLAISLNVPEDYLNSTNQSILFNCSATDETGVINITLIIDGIDNLTMDDGGAGNINLSLQTTKILSDGLHNWTCRATDGSGAGGDPLTATERYLTIDTTAPTVNSAGNLSNLTTTSYPVASNWNYTVSDASLDACYYHTSENATNITVACNSANINTNWTTSGINNITYCANDTFGYETCNIGHVTVAIMSYLLGVEIDPAVEGSVVNYTLQVNVTGIPMPTTTAYLVLNNTVYTPITSASSDHYDFNYALTIPTGWGNSTGNLIDWYWNYTIEGLITNATTTESNTTIYSISFDNCGSGGYMIMNLTLKDEETNLLLNGTSPNIEIDLTLTKGSFVWNYSNQWINEPNVTICIPHGILNLSNYTSEFIIGYSATDHVSEFFYHDNGTLSINPYFSSLTSRNIDLMDLLTADSTSFLFNYFDEDGLIVDDIVVHVFRKYIGEGIFREVERAKQNDDGEMVVHLVEEDVIYYFVISRNGQILFTSNTYTALCQTTPCEIQLEESGGFQEFDNDWDLIDNGGYSISVSSLTRTVNMTYALTTPSAMNLTVYQLISDGSYSVVESKQATNTGGSLDIVIPIVSGNTSFFASIYQDGDFKKSQWIDLEDDAGLYLGNVLSLFLGALIILALGLMAVSEGSATIIFLILGMFVAMVLGLVDYRTSTGGNVLIYFILAGGIIIWKLTRRNR